MKLSESQKMPSVVYEKIKILEDEKMKKILSIALVLVLVLSLLTACGGGNAPSGTPSGSNTTPASQGGSGSNGGAAANKNGDQALLTEDRITGDGSMAREQYYANTVREEFTFDKNDVLTGYKTIYTFENGVTDKQKQDAMDTLVDGNFAASIEGNTIVVDGDGYYLGFSYSESNFEEIKERLDDKGTQYAVGEIGKVSAPENSTDSSSPSVDINTVEGRLLKAGLELDDIKPDTFAEASLYNCDKDEVVMYLTNDTDMLGAAIMQPLVEKIMTATAAAGDGKNYETYYGLGDPTELDLSDANYDAWVFIGQWSYKVSDKWVTVTLGVLPAEEPDGQDNYSWEVTLAFLY